MKTGTKHGADTATFELTQMFHAPYENTEDGSLRHNAAYQKHKRFVYTGRVGDRIVRHSDPEPKIKAVRTRLEKDLTRWIKYFGGDAFSSPWSPDHVRVLKKIWTALTKGGLFAVAMPRGHGKSTILKWVIAFVLLTGWRKYVVVIAATAELAQSITEFIRQQITENDKLHVYYPHVTTYARATEGKAIKARYQLRGDGKTSGMLWSINTLVFPEVLSAKGEAYPSNGAILEAHGLTGAVRGKWKDNKSGEVLRPDFVMLDDPQDRSSAESASQCSMRERIIKGDVLGLAGPRKRIAAFMPCTIIRKGDLADRFLDHAIHPEWQGEICKLVNKWPAAQKTLWKEYETIYREETSEGRGFDKATEFYRAHRAEMDAGSDVSWASRVRDGEISALQTAENLLIETGEQFWAEYQNDPKEEGAGELPYLLDAKIICSRVADRQPFATPDWVESFIFSTDLNPSYAFSSAAVGFGKDQTAAIMWYGLFEKAPLPVKNDISKPERNLKVYEALVIHGKELASLRCKIEGWFIDASGEYFSVVNRFCVLSNRLCGIQATAATGSAAKNYKPYGKNVLGQPREMCHMRSFIDEEGRRKKWLNWHADYWREIAQRAWLGSVGSPGSISLFKGHHGEFAEQICREKLKGKGEVAGQMFWNWHTYPGKHDYGDVMAQAFAGAAWGGIGTSGQLAAAAPRRRASGVSVIQM
jgi:hypothetical protein